MAPFDWKVRKGQNDKSYLDTARLTVMGNIQAWKSGIHTLNYTLQHHCETDEERDWNGFTGRLVSYTGNPGGNDHGTQILDWKHGIMNHALSTVTLSTVQEDANWAGVCQGLTAAKDDTEIYIDGAVQCFSDYHGARQTIACADRGDAMCWIVLPLNSEIPANPHMLSGKYGKSVNAVSVNDEVIIHVNDDFSFTITEHTSSIVDAIQALQASVNSLLNQSHTHP